MSASGHLHGRSLFFGEVLGQHLSTHTCVNRAIRMPGLSVKRAAYSIWLLVLVDLMLALQKWTAPCAKVAYWAGLGTVGQSTKRSPLHDD